MSEAWKAHERKTAKLLGGERHKRGADFSEEAPDVHHPLFAVECKRRARIPDYLMTWLAQANRYEPNKPPLLVLKKPRERGELVVMRLADFVDLFGALKEHTNGRDERDAGMDPGTVSRLD